MASVGEYQKCGLGEISQVFPQGGGSVSENSPLFPKPSHVLKQTPGNQTRATGMELHAAQAAGTVARGHQATLTGCSSALQFLCQL